MSLTGEFDEFINGLDDAEPPVRTSTTNLCRTCDHFTPLDLPDLVVEGAGDCSFWEEGMDPTNTCNKWEKK